MTQPESTSRGATAQTAASSSASSRPPGFVTTRWSVVLAAKDQSAPGSSEALETLCRTYWSPLYAFVRRGRVKIADFGLAKLVEVARRRTALTAIDAYGGFVKTNAQGRLFRISLACDEDDQGNRRECTNCFKVASSPTAVSVICMDSGNCARSISAGLT